MSITGDGSTKEVGGGGAALVGEDVGKGEAGVVINGDMQVFPAGADAATHRRCDAVARAKDAAQFFDVQVEQVARTGALVALDRWRRIEIAHAVEASAAQKAADRGATQAGGLGDGMAGEALPTQGEHLGDERIRGRTTEVVWTGTAVA